jgi:hypothetical protein
MKRVRRCRAAVAADSAVAAVAAAANVAAVVVAASEAGAANRAGKRASQHFALMNEGRGSTDPRPLIFLG